MHVEFYSNLLIRKPAHLLGQFVYVWSFYAVSLAFSIIRASRCGRASYVPPNLIQMSCGSRNFMSMDSTSSTE